MSNVNVSGAQTEIFDETKVEKLSFLELVKKIGPGIILTIHAISHYYGKAAGAFTGFALFLTCCFFTIGNISGTGAGMQLIFGIDWKIGSMIMIVVLIYCYFSKGVYTKIEMIGRYIRR